MAAEPNVWDWRLVAWGAFLGRVRVDHIAVGRAGHAGGRRRRGHVERDLSNVDRSDRGDQRDAGGLSGIELTVLASGPALGDLEAGGVCVAGERAVLDRVG